MSEEVSDGAESHRQQPPLRISQVFSACTFCKARKIKCDGVAPACGGCVRFRRPSTCSLSTTQALHSRDYPTHLQARIQRLRAQLQRSQGDYGVTGRSALEDGRIAFNTGANERHGRASVIDTLVADIGVLPILASSYPSSTNGPSLSTVVLGAAIKASIASLEEDSLGQDSNTLLANGKPFLPKRNTAVRLAQHYIEHMYPRLPFFSIQGFWAQFNQVFLSPQHQSMPGDQMTPLSSGSSELNASEMNQGYSYFTVLLVLAIAASSLSRSSDSIVSSQARRLFHAGLGFRESAILPNNIVGVQSLLFLIQYAKLNPSVLDAWYLIGVGMRNCIDLGLHQDPQPLDSVTPSLLETRRRLWWSMYSFDRSMSLGCGRPVEISDAVIGVQLPTFRIESTATEFEIAGYLQRYRILRLQSQIYDTLNSAAESQLRDPEFIVTELLAKLEGWREGNPFEHSQTLMESEFHMGKMLLFRPCKLLPERTPAAVEQLWHAATHFIALYRQLVESNSIFYVQIASEKAYWAGLATLYSFWKLMASQRRGMRPVELWMGVKDALFILRTLSERWEDGKMVAEQLEKTSSRVIELIEAVTNWDELGSKLPADVVNFGAHVSLTSIWASQHDSDVGYTSANDKLHDLVVDIASS